MKLRYLNLGCGQRFHQDWENLDFLATAPGVRPHDLRHGIPFSNSSFDVVYHSHLLEHFPRPDAARLLRECYRVLKHGGIIRVAVPDLERIVRLYLEALDKSLVGDRTWQTRYEWILLEMYDQTVRETSGGCMLEYLHRNPIPERAFVEQRLGGEFRRLMARVGGPERTRSRFTFSILRDLLARKVARLALGREGIHAHDLGKFRSSGEVHRWMYDQYSLAVSLEKAGFQSPRKLEAAESDIPGWVGFGLDVEPDGSVYKPDSVFMEAIRS